MTRIEPLQPGTGGPFARHAFRVARKRVGVVPESIAVTARHNGVLAASGAFELLAERMHRVDERLKELAVLKAATIVECEFCMDIGSFIARRSGIGDAELLALARHADSDVFTDVEKLVLDYAAAMTRTPSAVTDELVAALREHFDEAQVVELTAMIAWENFRARFNAALGIEAQGFSEGAVCAVPEASAPAQPAAV
jgi:AhpD family alkylhydroperoxidase